MRKLGDILVKNGVMTASQVAEALTAAASSKMRFAEACLMFGFIDEKQASEALAEQYGLEAVSLEGRQIDREALDSVPVEVLHGAKVVPVKGEKGVILVTHDPTDILTLDEVERSLMEMGRRCSVAIAARGEIERLIKGSGTERLLREAAVGFGAVPRHEDEGEEVLTLESLTSDGSPAVKLVHTILFDAMQKRASDIHLETGREGLNVKYRIDGVLHKVMEPIERAFHASVISRLKVMSSLDISERRIPQDGRFRVRFRDKAIDFRLSIMPSVFGEDAVIRILDKEHISREFETLRLESLGLGAPEITKIRKMIREPYGMVLVTGPTGSGKTTTLYAALSEINTGEDKIITIEDPAEYELSGVVQIQVNEKKGLTFARGLRSILRHDPDKILVGEIRDPETAQIAIQAALTGHLVFTTVHANNVFDVIGRFVHMGIEPYNFVSSLNCILAQRLIRVLCERCKKPASLDASGLLESGLRPEEFAGHEFFEAPGCAECHNTGFRGRRAIIEILDLTDEVRDMIAAKEPVSEIRKKAMTQGMKTLRQAAVEKVLAGQTTLKEINRVTFIE